MAGLRRRHMTNHSANHSMAGAQGLTAAVGRRELLVAGGTIGIGLAAAGFSPSKAWGDPPFSDYPFKLGVASGDPWPDGFVLWTRLAPEPLALDGTGGMVPRKVEVRWE